jgi:hypothetical protein
MFFRGHYQNGYVTRDIDEAKILMSERFGLSDYVMFDPADIEVDTPYGRRAYKSRMALAWSGGLQIELIQPLNEDTRELYRDALAPEAGDFIPRFHHIAVRRPTVETLRHEVEQIDLPLLMEGEVPGFVFYYVDMRQQLGHHVEMTWATEEMWAYNKWPADRPVY